MRNDETQIVFDLTDGLRKKNEIGNAMRGELLVNEGVKSFSFNLNRHSYR